VIRTETCRRASGFHREFSAIRPARRSEWLFARGGTYHSGPGVFQRDREKDLVFRGAGFDVLRPTRAHVVYEAARVLALVAQALAGR
jgi:hypothetical protein